MKINTDPKKIEEFLTRGVENVYPNVDFVKKQLLSGKKLKMYLGIGIHLLLIFPKKVMRLGIMYSKMVIQKKHHNLHIRL